MILLIFVISGIITALMYVIYEKVNYDYSTIPFVIGCACGGLCFVSLIVGIVLIGVAASTSNVTDKIAMYEQENQEIEDSVYAMVQNYKEYEKSTYKEFEKSDAISYVSMYPELKSNTLVEKQIETYTANKTKINELREKQLDLKVMKWWLYFGG